MRHREGEVEDPERQHQQQVEQRLQCAVLEHGDDRCQNGASRSR